MILVFNVSLRGHYLEYFHHIYMGAIQRPEKRFLFAYPEEDLSQLKLQEWPTAPNVTLKPVKGLKTTGNMIRKARLYSKVLGHEVEVSKADEVILTDLIQYFPFLPFYVNKTSIKGIRYSIYLYTWQKDSTKKRCLDILKCLMFKYSRIVKRVFILADNSAAAYLNKLYKTDKFSFLGDPVLRIDKKKIHDLREEIGIPHNKTIVLHAGDLSYRKGTLSLLKGLMNCCDSVFDDYFFLFAGRVSPSIEKSFYELYEQLEKKTPYIKLITGFLPFDYLGSLVYSSDLLFLNYSQTEQSSGFVGYAAIFNKPVVVINSGLLKKIVRKYKLGYIIPDNSPSSICAFLDNYRNGHQEITSRRNSYIKVNSIANFVNTIIDG